MLKLHVLDVCVTTADRCSYSNSKRSIVAVLASIHMPHQRDSYSWWTTLTAKAVPSLAFLHYLESMPSSHVVPCRARFRGVCAVLNQRQLARVSSPQAKRFHSSNNIITAGGCSGAAGPPTHRACLKTALPLPCTRAPPPPVATANAAADPVAQPAAPHAGWLRAR